MTVINAKGFGRNRSWPILKELSQNFPELRRPRDRRTPGYEPNPGSLEFKPEMLTQPPRPVFLHII
jgi:hypothetical protein